MEKTTEGEEVDDDAIREEMISMWTGKAFKSASPHAVYTKKASVKVDLVKSLMESPMLSKIRQRYEQ